MNYTVKKITPSQFGTVWGFICKARAFQQEQGFVQWTPTAPSADEVRQGVEERRGYFLCEDGAPVGCFFLYEKDANYEAHPDLWKNQEPYMAVHRVVISTKHAGKGLSAKMFEQIRALCLRQDIHYMRIDTHEKNLRMQHVLEREGFTSRGKATFTFGERIAFESSRF